MNEKTLKTLEYEKIVNLLLDKAESELGRKKIEAIRPLTDIEEIERLQEATSEAYKIMIKRSAPPLFGIYDLGKEMQRIKIGGILEPVSLLRVSDSLRVSRRLKGYMRDNDGDRESSYPIIGNLIETLSTMKFIEEEIEKAIVSEDEISDNASSALKSIRREKLSTNNSIRKKLDNITSSPSYQKYLQDSIVTMREGRFVVPVKQEHRGNVSGIVHDMSSSGATVFIEPMAVVELNNKMRELDIKENEEIHKILKRLSELVLEESHKILYNQEILQELDFIFAKGKLALDMNGTKPILNKDRYINMKKARHPLLGDDEVVPIDVYLGEDFNTLVITGPNTGGKTVTLKTVGLLTAMAQSGLHIPADFNSEIGVFDKIFADIGDEQSIEQSLSTFSSHMTNIVSILDEVDENSLVLFDELGAGTDPTEGAALAISILENLLRRDIRTLATTHYSQLKVYALTTDNVNNASVEFDVETLSPTYRLLIGVPGKSNAFDISKRLGLQDFIIDDAKLLVSQESIELEDVLQSLEQDRLQAEENRMRTEDHRQEVEKLREELNRQKEKTENMREEILNKAKEEARAILRDAKKDADGLVKQLRGISGEIERERNIKIQETHEKLKTSLNQVESELSADVLNVMSNKPPENLKPGETVRVLAYDQVGEVLNEPDNKGDVQVQVGIMKINVNVTGLKRDVSQEEERSKTKTKHIMKNKSRNVKSELDLRGYNLADALMDVDKYLDDALLSGLDRIEIIHGKGTGVLREGITGYLKNHRNVKNYRLGDIGEGGDGVTIVELR